jgi:YfiH family protein
VLLADPAAGVIGAAHAGWRGAVGGVLDAVVAAMVGLGAERSRIRAAIGPAIALRSYEVGPEFRERLLADHPNNARYFREGPRGRPHFDLESYCAARLAAVGVSEVEALGIDTCTRPQYFYSYRRATLAGEPDYGRQLSLIALPCGR